MDDTAPSLAVGVGSRRGATAREVASLIDTVLAGAGLDPAAVRALATVDTKLGEPGIHAVARERGWEVLGFAAARLAGVTVPNPGSVALRAAGTPSVAEAAALLAAASGGEAELLVAKRSSARVSVAVARAVR